MGGSTESGPNPISDPVTLSVPGDKSISHRALLLAALSSGRSRLEGLLGGADTRATTAALRRLGVRVPPLRAGVEVAIDGVGLRGLGGPFVRLNCGNSGTTARLLLGILSAQDRRAVLTGDRSLRTRPMRRVLDPLAAMGATFHELRQSDRLPVEVLGGTLAGIEHSSPIASAQVKSALLLAGLCAGVRVSIEEPGASRDHTERLLGALGVSLTSTPLQGSARRITLVRSPERLPGFDLTVPGDFSSAAFFLVLAALAGSRPLRIHRVGLNPTRTGFLRIVECMGLRVDVERRGEDSGEPLGDLLVHPGRPTGTSVGPAEIPTLLDEVPALAVLATAAEGETRVTGAADLRTKESDRLASLVKNLVRIGADAEQLDDGLVVRGSRRRLAGTVTTHGDHRVAMAFGVLGALPGHRIAVDSPSVVEVSYPGFWTDLRRVAAELGLTK